MKQSRWMSLLEAVTNVLVGYGVAVATQWLVFPLFGLHATLQEKLAEHNVDPAIVLAVLRRFGDALGWGRGEMEGITATRSPCPQTTARIRALTRGACAASARRSFSAPPLSRSGAGEGHPIHPHLLTPEPLPRAGTTTTL